MSELPNYYLPDLLSQWPWPRVLNPHYEECKRESEAWLRSFEALDPKSQNLFDRCNVSLLSGLGYPLLDKDCLRAACDLMDLFFIYDEYTDKLDGDGARNCADIVMDALRNPHKERPQGESKLGEIARQFWVRTMKVSSEAAQKRFLESFSIYVYAVTDEALDRNGGHVRGIQDFLEVRRGTVAAYASYICVEMGLYIPDEVMAHPAIGSLLALVADCTLLTNDLYSYNNEQAAGHGGHNILTVVMNEKGVDLNGALEWLAEYNDTVLSRFQAQYRMLPSWGPDLDPTVKTFVERLAFFIRGHDSWSFESERYFGPKGPEIQKLREVTMFPKSKKADVTPMLAQPGALTC